MVAAAAFAVVLSALLDLSCFFNAVGLEGILPALWTGMGKLAVIIIGGVACLPLQGGLKRLIGQEVQRREAHLWFYRVGFVRQQ